MKQKVVKLLRANFVELYCTEHCQLINLTREQSRALTVLSYSDNEELQRTAAFFFSEISEQCECAMLAVFLGWGLNVDCRYT